MLDYYRDSSTVSVGLLLELHHCLMPRSIPQIPELVRNGDGTTLVRTFFVVTFLIHPFPMNVNGQPDIVSTMTSLRYRTLGRVGGDNVNAICGH